MNTLLGLSGRRCASSRWDWKFSGGVASKGTVQWRKGFIRWDWEERREGSFRGSMGVGEAYTVGITVLRKITMCGLAFWTKGKVGKGHI